MAKLTLTDILSGYDTATAFNANNTLIEAAIENTLSRDGTSPNAMEADIDMDSNKVINLGTPQSNSDAARWVDVTDSVDITGIAAPSQTGNADKPLKTDGTSAAWGSIHSDHVDYTQGGTGSTERTVLSKLQDVLSVKDFGATGDGSTDDTTALQAAFTAGANKNVIIPSGTYIFTALTIPSNSTIIGRGGVLKYKDNTATADPNIAYYPVLTNTTTNVRLLNVEIDGNSTNNTPGSPGALWVADMFTMVSASNITVDGCYFHDGPDSGIMFSNCTDSKVVNCNIDTTNDAGVYYNDGTGGTTAHTNVISGNTISQTKDSGIAIKRHGEAVTIDGNNIYDCGNGMTIEDFTATAMGDPDRFIVSNNVIWGIGTITNHGTAHIGMSIQRCTNSIFTGNLIYACENEAVSFSGSSGNTFTGNVIVQTSSSDATNGKGIVLEVRTSPNVGCDRNIIANNRVEISSSGTAAEAIKFVNSASADHQYNVISGNSFVSNGWEAFRVDANFKNNIIQGNFIEGDSADNDVDINIAAGTNVYNMWVGNIAANNNFTGSWGGDISDFVGRNSKNRTLEGDASPQTGTGTWIQGDICYNTNVAAGGTVGWVCTTSGTPGTWKTFGTVAA